MYSGKQSDRTKGSVFGIKQPLKRVQMPLNKFNDVAVPHHVDLLKRHKSNIEKFQSQEAWDQVHREQVNATRLVKQLKALLYEIDVLRNQVQESDLAKFDKLTANARQNAQDAITEYLNLIPQKLTSSWSPNSCMVSSSSECVNFDVGTNEEKEKEKDFQVQQLQEHVDVSSEQLAKQEQCLRSYEHLQSEVHDINELFKDFSKIVHEQQESVDQIEISVETASENVAAGASHLRLVKTAMYPLAGAFIGGCVGGPVGFLAGMKLGGLTALGCSFLGFTGGKMLKKKKEEELNQYGVELLNLQQNRNIKGSASLPYIGKSELLSEKSPQVSSADI